MAVNQQAQGAEGSSSRHRRRRDHGNGGNQPAEVVNPQTPGPVNQKGGGRSGGGANKMDSAKVDSSGRHYSGQNSNGYGYGDSLDGGGSGKGRGGGGRWGGTGYGGGFQNGDYGGYGYGGGRGPNGEQLQSGGRGYHQHQQQHQQQYQPPWHAPPEEHSLKDLLLQVAPQARIAENTSRLSSKASANILSKCLGAAATTSQPEWMSEDTGTSWGGASWGADASWSGGGAASSADNSMPDYGGGGGGGYGNGVKHEDDEESAFMERWSGLFSKNSPLVDGSCQDPFQDMKSRAKVVWKSNRDRAGHRQRYQQRKAQKEQTGKEDDEDDGGQADGGASIVYDAFAPQQPWTPDRPPAGM